MAGDKFKKTGTKLSELEESISARLEDAKVLAASNRNASAIAMGLYALEISLKVAICRRLDMDALLTDFQIHDFEGLLRLSGLSRRIEHPTSARVRNRWDFIVQKYNQFHADRLRYSAGDDYLPEHARELLGHLDDPTDGVLTWLSAQT